MNNTIPEDNSTTFQTRRAATNNPILSSLRKTTLELPQAKRSRFVNSSLTVTLAAHLMKQKRKNVPLALKELFRLPGNWEYKTTQNYKLLQPTYVRCHVILCNKQPEMKW